MKKRIFLVDGNSFIYRAFFATPYLATSKGVPTNATFATTNMILKLIKEGNPDSIVVIFDSKVPSFRHEISKEYKAQRKPMPSNLIVQIPYIKEIVESLGIPIIEIEGYEADDVIGTLVQRLKNPSVDIYVVTGDKDLMQFVGDGVYVYDTMKEMIFGEKEVEEKFGVSPSKISDLLALAGDTSDNIPGIPGIGEKTAQALIREFGSIETLYENIGKLKKESLKKKLVEGKDLAFLSKNLASIKTDVPLRDLEIFRPRKPDYKRLRSLFRELEFSSLLKEIPEEKRERYEFREIPLKEMDLSEISIYAFFEAKELKGFSIYDGKSFYYSKESEDLLYALEKCRSVSLYDLKQFFLSGFSLEAEKAFDIMLATFLLNPLRKDLRLETIVAYYLGFDISTGFAKEDLFEKAKAISEVKKILEREIEEKGLKNLFYSIEMPISEVLAEMEKSGVKVDVQRLRSISEELSERLNRLSGIIFKEVGEEFNINSPKQLSHILFEKLKLKPQKRTKKGFSTDTEVLEELIDEHPVIKHILEFRTLHKLKSTYLDSLPSWIDPKTRRIHPSFNQTNVLTGRLSTQDPNLQNIPIRGDEGKRIREAFVSEDGFLLMSSDYSQIELRILAHLSKDEALIESFRRGEDIHTKVAMEVFKVDETKVTPDMRRTAKVINFGIIYGMSPYGLSRELGISQDEAEKYIEDYFKIHVGVKEYMEKVVDEAKEKGYVRTLFGRIRYIPELRNPDQKVFQMGVRYATNTPIQGTAADLIKLAMVNIFRRKTDLGLSSKLILQIHDELLFEVKEEEIEIMENLVRYEMENVYRLIVPLKVSIGFGKNWAEAKS